MKATKHDERKPRISNIPGKVLMSVARVFDFGAKKYDRYNYRRGMEWSRYYDACVRHITSWFDGGDFDDESGLHHIDHAICCLIMLRANIIEDQGIDDRYKKVSGVDEIIETTDNTPIPMSFLWEKVIKHDDDIS